MNKICVFDFDGVIANSIEVGYAMHNNIKDKYNLPLVSSKNDYLEVIDNSHINNRLNDKVSDYYKECNDYYRKRIKDIRLYPRIKELLLEKKKPLYIISSSPEEFLKEILEREDIKDAIIYGKGKIKTKRDRFEILLKEHKLSKEDILYVGDTIDDYNFCTSVGIPMLGSNYGYSNLESIKDKLYGLKSSEEKLIETIKPFMLIK